MAGLLVAGLLPFAAAAGVWMVPGPRSLRPGIAACAVVAVCFALVLSASPSVLLAPAYAYIPWVPELGINFSVRFDALSLLFALLITGIGLVVFTFAAAYLGPDENRRRFFCYLLFFMGSMLGVVAAANLISLFVFWELTSISSFLLIGFWHTKEASRNGALKALLVTAGGGLAMLVGFVMIGIVCGSFEISEVIERRGLIAESPWAGPAAVLILLGALTKSAQLPFHFWLPSAMEAPTPVSAYLHAATMVKAGLYLVARLGPAFVDVEIWAALATAAGLATMAWGSLMALKQADLKGLLAFSTVSQLGLILSLLAVSSNEATAAGLFHLLNHGLFKGALFLLVGIIEHEAHTRDLRELGALRRRMPIVHTLLAIGALSMAGVPPLGGFVSKELFLEWHLHAGTLPAVVAVVGSMLTAAYCFVLVIGLARGRGEPSADAAHAHDPGPALLWGPGLLIGLAVAIGLAPQAIAGKLIEQATAAANAGNPPHLHLALWHGPNLTLAASAVAITGGLVLFAGWWQRRDLAPPVLWMDRAYEAFLVALERGARALTASYMSGYLWRYVAIPLSVGIAGVAATFVGLDGGAQSSGWHARTVQPFEWLVVATALGAAVATVFARTRLAAILALGASGYSLALLFSLLQAPDLALTQIMVETISVALFLTIFVFMPPYRPSEVRNHRPAHAALAIVFGFGVAGLIYLTRAARVAPTISEYFVENSVAKAGGHNVVNVILVDFRGLDTLGEITVLAVAALSAFAIVKGLRARKAS